MQPYDLVVIGGGTAGLVTAAGAAHLGARVALIERDRLGGECLYTGCVPTKALIMAAKVAAMARNGERFGVRTSEVTVDYAGVRDHIRRVIAAIQKHDSIERFTGLGVDVIKGEAQFAARHQLAVGEQMLESRRFVLATGSRSTAPPIPGLEQAGFWTHVEALEAERLPESLIVLGAGPIGLEFAQAFTRLGVRVIVLEAADRILTREDAEISALARATLEAEGVEIHTGCAVTAVNRAGQEKAVATRDTVYQAEEILVAAGRTANWQELNLPAVGVELAGRFIAVDNTLRTTAPHVWAAGDAAGPYPFTHTANYQGRLVVRNALFPFRAKADYRIVPWVTFLDPELAHLGMTEDEARASADVRVYRYAFSDLDRALAEGEGHGLIKAITDRSGRLLGAHILGPGAGELIHEFALAMKTGARIGDLSQMIHAYPTLSEGVQRTADLYWRDQLFAGSGGRWLRRLTRFFL